MQRGIRAERELAEVSFFHFDQQLFVLGAQALEDAGVDHDAELEIRFVPRSLLEDFAQLALDLDAHGDGALHPASAFAVGAIVIDRVVHAFRMALAGHFHEAELRNGEDVCLGFVPPQAFFHLLIDLLLVPARLHVNEIEHDQAAHVAQAQLPGDFLRGLEVHLEDGRFLVLAALVAACVHIDRHERFRFVHDDVAAALEVHLAGEGVFELARDAEPVEDRLRLAIHLDFVGGPARYAGDHVPHPVVRGLAVHHDAFDVLRQKVAHGALDQVRFLEHAGGGGLFLDAFLDVVPFLEQQRQVPDEVSLLLSFANGAHNHAHPVRDGQFAQDFLEALALLLILDLAGNAALVGIGQQHEVASGQDDVGGNAGSLGADGALGDLHDDVAAGRVNAGDILLCDFRAIAALVLALDDFHAAVEGARHDVPIMQKSVFLEPDINKRRLEAVLEIADFALEDAADEAFLGGALDVELLEAPFLEDGDACLESFGIDDHLLVDLFHRLDQPLDLFDEVGGGGADGIHDAARWLGDAHRLERFLRRGGRLDVRLSEILFAGCGFVRRHALGRQAGGDVFGAFDFVRMPVLIDAVVDRVVLRCLDARLCRFLVRALHMPKPAGWAESHAAPASA